MRLAVLVLVFLGAAAGAVVNVTGADSSASILQTIRSLQAGDTISFGAKTTYRLDGLVLTRDGLPGGTVMSGTPGNPITFTSDWDGVNAADRPLILADVTKNGQSLGVFNIMNGQQYITIEKLHLRHTGTVTSCGLHVWGGIWFEGGASNIIIFNNEIDQITGTGIQMDKSSSSNVLSDIVIQSNHVHDTGTATQCSSNGGYSVWWGKSSPQSNVIGRDITVTFNIFSDTGGVDSYALALQHGFIRCDISDNVIYNAPRGVGTGERYMLLLEGSSALINSEADMLLFKRNLMYASDQSGRQNVAALISPGVDFSNNLIVDSWCAIALRPTGWPSYSLTRVNANTIFNARADNSKGVFSLNNLKAADAASFEVQNNAVYCNCGTSCNGIVAFRWVGTQSTSMKAGGNYYQGTNPGEGGSVWTALSNDPATLWNNPGDTIGGGVDFVPLASGVLGAGAVNMASPTDDYDKNSRPATGGSVGCYQMGGSPHSAPSLSFKAGAPGSPTGGGSGGGSGGGASVSHASFLLVAVCCIIASMA